MQAGGDLVNVVKQYNEFKLQGQGHQAAVGLMFITDIHSLSPDALAGTTFTDAWYWNFDERQPRWADQFSASRRPADVRPRRQLLGRHAVPGGGAGGRHRRRRHDREAAGGQDGQRLFLRNGTIRPRTTGAARRLPAPGEAVKRGQGALGLREDRSTIPADRRSARSPTAPRPAARWAEPVASFLQQFFNGLVGGAFLALLALGLSVIFGMLGVVNFAHGAFYMLGAFGAYVLLTDAGVSFWVALIVVPVALGLFGMLLERLLIHRLTALDPLYNFLLTFGLTLVLQDLVRRQYSITSAAVPAAGRGSTSRSTSASSNTPATRVFVVRRRRRGLRRGVGSAHPHPRRHGGARGDRAAELTRAFGIDVARWVAPVFGFGVALAGLSGVLAAPMRAIHPLMGADLIIVVFAVVVIGGLGSIFGSVAAGFAIGLIQAWGEAYASALLPGELAAIVSQVLVFVVMAAVLLWRPSGLFGREEQMT
jgi:branched-chain amino acid transport system permease protein